MPASAVSAPAAADASWERAGMLAVAAAIAYTALAWLYEWRVFVRVMPAEMHLISPILVWLKAHGGSLASHSFGKLLLDAQLALAGLAVLWPIRWFSLPRRAVAVVAVCAVAPIVLINAAMLDRALVLFTAPHVAALIAFVGIAAKWPARGAAPAAMAWLARFPASPALRSGRT